MLDFDKKSLKIYLHSFFQLKLWTEMVGKEEKVGGKNSQYGLGICENCLRTNLFNKKF